MKGIIYLIFAVGGIGYSTVSYFQDRSAQGKVDIWVAKQPSMPVVADRRMQERILKNIARQAPNQQAFELEADKYIGSVRKIIELNTAIRDYKPLEVRNLAPRRKPPSANQDSVPASSGLKFTRPDAKQTLPASNDE